MNLVRHFLAGSYILCYVMRCFIIAKMTRSFSKDRPRFAVCHFVFAVTSVPRCCDSVAPAYKPRTTFHVRLAEYSKSDPPSRIKSRSRLQHGRLFATKRRHTYVIGRIPKYLSFARTHTAEWISRVRNLGSQWHRYWILNGRCVWESVSISRGSCLCVVWATSKSKQTQRVASVTQIFRDFLSIWNCLPAEKIVANKKV